MNTIGKNSDWVKTFIQRIKVVKSEQDRSGVPWTGRKCIDAKNEVQLSWKNGGVWCLR